MSRRPHVVVRFDYRMPGATSKERAAAYAASLDMAALADTAKFDSLSLSEHHGSDDGYLPSPLTVAAAMAARTTRIPMMIAAIQVNLYDPIRLAEEIAVLDHLSGGRIVHVFALGYRPEEYALLGKEWAGRGAAIEENISTMLAAWRGDEITRGGMTHTVAPQPLSQPHPMIFYGGGSKAAARRAARLGLHFQPQAYDPELRRVYLDACVELGREPGLVVMPPDAPAVVFCATDPDRFWAQTALSPSTLWRRTP